ncbi:MAG: chorismate synthase, partial [Novibacillus thermophilus]
LYKPLKSVDIDSKETVDASIERSDNCAVPAASVVVEGVVSWEIACALCDKFSRDTLTDLLDDLAAYRRYAKEF